MQQAGGRRELVDEAVVQLAGDVDALDRAVRLPGAGARRPQGAGDRARDVGVGEHDHRVGPALLDDGLATGGRALPGDVAGDPGAPGEQHAADPRGAG